MFMYPYLHWKSKKKIVIAARVSVCIYSECTFSFHVFDNDKPNSRTRISFPAISCKLKQWSFGWNNKVKFNG